jgi:hypothetical protein
VGFNGKGQVQGNAKVDFGNWGKFKTVSTGGFSGVGVTVAGGGSDEAVFEYCRRDSSLNWISGSSGAIEEDDMVVDAA